MPLCQSRLRKEKVRASPKTKSWIKVGKLFEKLVMGFETCRSKTQRAARDKAHRTCRPDGHFFFRRGVEEIRCSIEVLAQSFFSTWGKIGFLFQRGGGTSSRKGVEARTAYNWCNFLGQRVTAPLGTDSCLVL